MINCDCIVVYFYIIDITVIDSSKNKLSMLVVFDWEIYIIGINNCDW